MILSTFGVIFIFLTIGHCSICEKSSQRGPPLRGPPQFEQNPQYTSSYLPASMQIMAYLTELMKYDLRPGGGSATTTTVRPTPPHRPGLYAPNMPPGPSAYFAQRNSYEEYVEKLRGGPDDGLLWVENMDAIKKILEQLEPGLKNSAMNDLDLLGADINDLHMLVNGLKGDDNTLENDDLRVQKFSENFDDSQLPSELLKQKRTPPTRAYVTLLSLYDLLNKESKRLGLNKYNGYSQRILADLIETSTGTSSYQLKHVLQKLVAQRDTTDPTITKKIQQLLIDLDQSDSYINVALRYIPPLPFEK